jgi:hypothetical protein
VGHDVGLDASLPKQCLECADVVARHFCKPWHASKNLVSLGAEPYQLRPTASIESCGPLNHASVTHPPSPLSESLIDGSTGTSGDFSPTCYSSFI